MNTEKTTEQNCMLCVHYFKCIGKTNRRKSCPGFEEKNVEKKPTGNAGYRFWD